MPDLGELAVDVKTNDGIWHHLENPHTKAKYYLSDDREKPMRIKVAGLDSKIARQFERENSKRLGTETKLEKDGIKFETDAQLTRVYNFDRLVELTLDWENIAVDGEVWDFNKNTVRKLYEKAPDILDQVADCVGERSNFTEGQSID